MTQTMHLFPLGILPRIASAIFLQHARALIASKVQRRAHSRTAGEILTGECARHAKRRKSNGRRLQRLMSYSNQNNKVVQTQLQRAIFTYGLWAQDEQKHRGSTTGMMIMIMIGTSTNTTMGTIVSRFCGSQDSSKSFFFFLRDKQFVPCMIKKETLLEMCPCKLFQNLKSSAVYKKFQQKRDKQCKSRRSYRNTLV